MTENSQFKKAVRDRMAATGERYTTARRALLVQAVEPHYLFTPPGTIERLDVSGRRSLDAPDEAGPGFRWGYNGTGPNTCAWALLLDATGSCDLRLAIAFTSDNLDMWDVIGDRSFVITVAEVQAWRKEAEPRVRRKEAEVESHGPTVASFGDMSERIDAYKVAAAKGPRRLWWQSYRAANGEPRLL